LVGITERKTTPTLKQVEKVIQRMGHREQEESRNAKIYGDAYSRLIDFSLLAQAHLDEIDEPLIERFKSAMLAKEFSKTSVNRYLATLPALRYASRKLKLFNRLPVIEMYSREDGAERECIHNRGQSRQPSLLEP